MNPSPALLQVPDPRQANNFIIALASVRDFGAKGDGGTDDTAAFSRAIGSVVRKGGGTVFVPAGRYAIKGNLIVPRSVYLCGEWKNPDEHPEVIAKGTVLLAYAGRNQPDGKAFITVGGSAGLIGITVYYPEQTPGAPTEYPPTIELSDRLDGNSTGCSTLQRVTLINPFVGVRAGIDCVQLQILDGVYISPISQGVFIRISWDVPRLHNISIGPKYWQSFDPKLKGVEKIPGIMRETASGMVLGHSTWNFIYNLSISDCKIGVHFYKDPTFKEKGMNFADGQIDKLSIRNSGTGLLLTCGDGGIAVSKADIEADQECIEVADSFASVVTFLDSKFTSNSGSLVRIAKNSGAILSMQKCAFGKWSQRKAAIELNGGVVTLHDNVFAGSGTSVEIGKEARGASISRNSYTTSFEEAIKGMREGKMFAFEDSRPENVSAYPNYDLKLTDPIALARREIFDIRSFGGKAAEGFDNTTAISEALNAAKTAGGGVVFVPAGNYLVNGTLTVPENVELRGISESIHHTSGGGSVLMTTTGEGDPSATPFISLERRSALRGITIWYPNQLYWKIQPYPWAVRVLGQDVTVRFLTLGNAFKGVDMAAGDAGGHYIEGLAGMTFSQVLQLDGSTKAGVIRNVHFNPHFLIESRGTNLPGNGDDVNARNVSYKTFSETVFRMQDQHNVPFTIGKVTDETIFSVFNYRSNIGMRLTGGFDGILHSVGLDGTISDVEITGEQQNPVIFVNCVLDLVPGSTVVGNGNMFINTKNSADILILNGKFGAWNYVPPQGIEISEGNVSMWSCYFTVTPTDGAVKATGGNAELRGCVFGHLDVLTGNDGTSDAVGFYTFQKRDVKDVVASDSAQVQSIGSVGVNSLNLVGNNEALRGSSNIVVERH